MKLVQIFKKEIKWNKRIRIFEPRLGTGMPFVLHNFNDIENDLESIIKLIDILQVHNE